MIGVGPGAARAHLMPVPRADLQSYRNLALIVTQQLLQLPCAQRSALGPHPAAATRPATAPVASRHHLACSSVVGCLYWTSTLSGHHGDSDPALLP